MKKTIILSLLFFLYSCILFAQTKRIDSLENLLKTVKKDTNKVIILNRLTSMYLRVPNYTKALPHAEESRLLAEELRYTRGAAKAYENLGTIYGYFGAYDKAFENSLKELKAAESLKDSEIIIRAYNDMSFAYSLQKKYKEALEINLMLHGIIERTGDTSKIKTSLWAVGGACMNHCMQLIKQRDSASANYYYNEAIVYKVKALEICQQRKDSVDIAILYNNLGFIYDKCNLCDETDLITQTALIKANYYSQAETNYFRSLKIYNKLNNKNGILESFSLLGLFYRNQGNLAAARKEMSEANANYQKSLNYYLKTLEVVNELGYKHGIANYSKEVGLGYWKLEKMREASEYILNAAIGFTEIGYKEGAKESFEILSTISFKQENYEKAFKYYKSYVELKDSILNEATAKQLTEMSIKYETEKKTAALIAQQILTGKEKEKRRLITVLLAVIIILIVSISSFVSHRRKSSFSLRISQIENKFLRFQLQPHFISNVLSAIKNYIHEYPEIADGYFDKYIRLMRQVLENSNKENISLEEEISMLKKYMDLESLRVESGFDYNIIIDAIIDEELVQVPPLILQPIIENAIAHGLMGRRERGKIMIHISLETNILHCVVENYCAGMEKNEINKDKDRKSFGLQLIKDRLKLMSKGKQRKGYLDMFQQSGGMTVQLGIPM